MGALAFSEKDANGEPIYPRLELFRLAVPRRVYSYRHMDVVADGIGRVLERKEKIRGLKIIYEPALLRHFLAQMARV